MEESGMESRGRGHPGLLRTLVFCLALLSAGAPLGAQTGPEEPLEVSLELSASSVEAGGSVTLSLLVRHPNPTEVAVFPGRFPAAVVVQRIRTEPRSLPAPSGAEERWTRVEYSLRVLEAGTFVLGPFGISAAGNTAVAAPVTIVAAPGRAETAPLRTLVWTGIPARARPGVPFECSLVASGFVPAENAEAPAPEDAVFEPLPISSQDRQGGVVARFRVTPLGSRNLTLPEASIADRAGGRVAARPVSLPLDASDGGPIASLAEGPPDQRSPARRADPAFVPDDLAEVLAERIPRFVASIHRRSLTEASAAWSVRDYVSALSVLRAAERDSVLGPALASARRAAERTLSLSDATAEPWTPLALAAGAAACGLLAGIAALSAIRGKGRLFSSDVTSAHRRRFISSIAACAVFLSIAAVVAFTRLTAAPGVVLSACESYRVPDPESARSASFAEGQAARELARAGDWLYVETGDGRFGWIEAFRARHY